METKAKKGNAIKIKTPISESLVTDETYTVEDIEDVGEPWPWFTIKGKFLGMLDRPVVESRQYFISDDDYDVV